MDPAASPSPFAVSECVPDDLLDHKPKNVDLDFSWLAPFAVAIDFFSQFLFLSKPWASVVTVSESSETLDIVDLRPPKSAQCRGIN